MILRHLADHILRYVKDGNYSIQRDKERPSSSSSLKSQKAKKTISHVPTAASIPPPISPVKLTRTGHPSDFSAHEFQSDRSFNNTADKTSLGNKHKAFESVIDINPPRKTTMISSESYPPQISSLEARLALEATVSKQVASYSSFIDNQKEKNVILSEGGKDDIDVDKRKYVPSHDLSYSAETLEKFPEYLNKYVDSSEDPNKMSPEQHLDMSMNGPISSSDGYYVGGDNNNTLHSKIDMTDNINSVDRGNRRAHSLTATMRTKRNNSRYADPFINTGIGKDDSFRNEQPYESTTATTDANKLMSIYKNATLQHPHDLYGDIHFGVRLLEWPWQIEVLTTNIMFAYMCLC